MAAVRPRRPDSPDTTPQVDGGIEHAWPRFREPVPQCTVPRQGRLGVTANLGGTWPEDRFGRDATAFELRIPDVTVDAPARDPQVATQWARTPVEPERAVEVPPLIAASSPQVGFIDHGEGANVRTAPNGNVVGKLAPGARVVVIGTHRTNSEWRYVTSATMDDKSGSVSLIQGCVKASLIATDAPEPGAILYQVASGDTAESVVRKHYAGPKPPGFDLRFFENVLQYVNSDKRPQGVHGTGRNMQLVAGQRIWLVSPSYAARLEGFVPSGSYTGGKFAQAKAAYADTKSRLRDVLDTMEVSREVAGEYWEFLNDNKVAIAGTLAAVVALDWWSWKLAASPVFGPGQVVALGIQALLLLAGAAGAAVYTADAVTHGTAWLDLAWHSERNPKAMKDASREYTHMLVQTFLALGSLVQVGISLKLLPRFTRKSALFLREGANPLERGIIDPRPDDLVVKAGSPAAEPANDVLPSSAAPATPSTSAVGEPLQAQLAPSLRSLSLAPAASIPVTMAGGGFGLEEFKNKEEFVAHLQSKYPALLKGFPPLTDIEADFRAGGRDGKLLIDALIEKAKGPAAEWFHKLKGVWEADESARPLAPPAPRVVADTAKPFPHIAKRTAIVSMRLPSLPSRSSGEAGTQTVGGVANAILSTLREMTSQGLLENGAVWIGWSGNQVANPEHGFAGSEVLPLAWFDFTPAMYEAVYEGVANSEFWFLLHSMTKGLTFNAANWKVFVEANQLFADHVRTLMDDGVDVWLHDYQIPLVAKMLRDNGHKGPIGQTWHVPWPPLDVLIKAPWWDQVVDALLYNDLLTFHIADDVKRFVAAAVHLGAKRVDGGKDFHRVILKYKDKNDETKTIRTVEVRAVPIGIEPADFEVHPVPTAEGHQVGKLTSDDQDIQVMFGGGRADPTKNIDGQILAYEWLLQNHPEWLGKVVLVQVSVPSRGGIDAYAKKQQEIRKIIDRINDTYKTDSWIPIIHFERAFDQKELLLFYRLADVMAIMSLKDGMNLMAMEATAAFDLKNPGVLVLSTGAGASKVLTEAVMTDPESIEDMGKAYKRALEMSSEERTVRQARNRARVGQTTSSLWGRTILTILDSFKSLIP